MRGKAKSTIKVRIAALIIVLMSGVTRRDKRAVIIPDPRNPPMLKSA
jgi:hypothetical protein